MNAIGPYNGNAASGGVDRHDRWIEIAHVEVGVLIAWCICDGCSIAHVPDITGHLAVGLHG